MALSLPRYNVLIADPEHPDDPDHAVEHEVIILHGDQLRAELEGPRNGIPAMDVAAIHGITLWIWAALVRTHVIEDVFQVFRPRLLAFEAHEPDEGAQPGEVATPADPTQPAAGSGSPSASHSTSAISVAGSTALSPTLTD